MAGMKRHDHVKGFIPSEKSKSESTEDQETLSEVCVRESGQIHRICQMTSSNEGMSRTGASIYAPHLHVLLPCMCHRSHPVFLFHFGTRPVKFRIYRSTLLGTMHIFPIGNLTHKISQSNSHMTHTSAHDMDCQAARFWKLWLPKLICRATLCTWVATVPADAPRA